MRNSRQIRYTMPGYYAMCLIGEAYGYASTAFNAKRAVEAALKRLGGEQKVVATFSEEDFEWGGCHTRVVGRTISNLLYDICEARNYPIESLDEVHNLQSLREVYQDAMYSCCVQLEKLETQEEYDTRKTEEKRKSLETSAAVIARKHNCSCNSIQFLQALEEEIAHNRDEKELWNNPEVRMEEWAAHRHSGSSEGYFDDLNYVNGRISSDYRRLLEVREWVSQNCPLLWAKWEDAKMTPAS